MRDLVESILTGDNVEAGRLFESHMESIVEKKLYEKKRMMQAEASFPGGRAGVEARKAAGFRKATDVLGDPSKSKLKPLVKLKKKKTVKEETLDEAGLGDAAKIVHKLSPIRKAVASRLFKAKREFMKGYKKGASSSTSDDEFAQHAARSAGAEPSHAAAETPKTTRNGIVRRNWNTLNGREPGYKPEPKTPEQKGGRLGKAARFAGKTWGNILSKGMSGPLEE